MTIQNPQNTPVPLVPASQRLPANDLPQASGQIPAAPAAGNNNRASSGIIGGFCTIEIQKTAFDILFLLTNLYFLPIIINTFCMVPASDPDDAGRQQNNKRNSYFKRSGAYQQRHSCFVPLLLFLQGLCKCRWMMRKSVDNQGKRTI